MRRQIMVMGALLALAACGENAGWNPNYRAKATPYGDYLRARESALMGRRADPPRIVPVTLPVKAPTPEQISGHSMRPVPEATLARTRKPAGAPSIDPYPSEPVLADRKTVAAGAVVVVAMAPPQSRSVLPARVIRYCRKVTIIRITSRVDTIIQAV